jgi:hypothetical protein
MIEGLQLKSIEDIVDDMTDAYTKGDYLDGYTQDGDDAICLGFGYRESEIIPAKMEIEEWCQEHLSHLESKFR